MYACFYTQWLEWLICIHTSWRQSKRRIFDWAGGPSRIKQKVFGMLEWRSVVISWIIPTPNSHFVGGQFQVAAATANISFRTQFKMQWEVLLRETSFPNSAKNLLPPLILQFQEWRKHWILKASFRSFVHPASNRLFPNLSVSWISDKTEDLSYHIT